MGTRKNRSGLEAVMACQTACAKELMKLPAEERPAVVRWLEAAVMNRSAPPGTQASVPTPPDPRQVVSPILNGEGTNDSGFL